MRLLTDAERRRFSEWLKQDAESNVMLAEQLRAMPHLAALMKMKQALATAEILVARELDSAESQTI